MQFTPQQLAGGSSYMCKTKVGNWLEDQCLQEEKLSEFARNRDQGSSLMYNVMGKRNLYATRVPLAPRAGGTIRYGDVIMLGHPSTGGVLGVDLTEACLDANRNQKLVSCAMPGGEPDHCARYSFMLEPTTDDTQEGDDVHFGESVLLRCHDLLVLDEQLGATRPPFYLASGLKNDRNGSRVSNQQTIFATTTRNMAAAWTFEKVSGNTGVVRQLSGGEAVPCGTGLNGPTVVLQHKTTKTAMSASTKNWDSTDFGRELEVTCHNHLGQNKVNCLVSEMAGKTTGQTNGRLEKSPNFWTVIGDVEGSEQPEEPELPPPLNAEQMVRLLSERVALVEGAADRLVALAEGALGSNLDREDLAYELGDIGLGFDGDATRVLLDVFDEGDGMVPINAFLDAALAQMPADE
jgi:hypothetical protein